MKLKDFFQKDSVLIGSVVCGCILQAANGGFNLIAGDWQALAVNVCYMACLIVLCVAVLKDEKNTIQAAIGAIMMNFVWSTVNVFSELISEDIPSRSRWGLILNIIMVSILFINHFMLTMSSRKKLWRVQVNQAILLFFFVFTIYKIAVNLATGQFSTLMVEILIGISAMLPTLCAIVCVEYRSGTYSLFQITTFNPIVETSRQADYITLFEELGFKKRHVKVLNKENGATSVRMKDPYENYIDINLKEGLKNDVTLIRINVDDLEKACGFMESHGFKELEGSRSKMSSSESVRMISPSGLAVDVIMHIRKR